MSSPDQSSEASPASALKQPLFQFGVIADVQYADKPDGMNYSKTRVRRYRQSLHILDEAIKTWESEVPNMAFVLQLGDVIDASNRLLTPPHEIDREFGAENQSYSSLARVLSRFARIKTPLILNVVGNHELYNFTPQRLRELHATNPFQGYHYLQSINYFKTSSRTENTTPAEDRDSNATSNSIQSLLPRASPDVSLLHEGGAAHEQKQTADQEDKQSQPTSSSWSLRIRSVDSWYILNDWPIFDLIKTGVRNIPSLDPQYPQYPGLPVLDPVTGEVTRRGMPVPELPCDYFSFSPAPNWRVIMLNSYEITSIVGQISSNLPNHADLSHVAEFVSQSQKISKEIADAILHENNPNIRNGHHDWTVSLTNEQKKYLPYNGALGASQRAWLADQLESAQKRGERVLIASHVPVFSRYLEYETLLWDCEEVLKLLQQYAGTVVAYFAGHDHDGAYEVDPSGIYHITPPAPIECDVGEVAYSYVTVMEDALEIVGFGKCPSMRLPIPSAPPSATSNSSQSSQLETSGTTSAPLIKKSRPESRYRATYPVVAPQLHQYLSVQCECPAEHQDE